MPSCRCLLTRRFEAYADLIDSADEALLTQQIDVPKHKSLAEHLWCVVGARESYAKALEHGAWQGFDCSMDSYDVEDFRTKLAESADAAATAIDQVENWNDTCTELLATLAEHEVMHEGQIIRHMHALEKPLPASWIWS